MVLPVSSRVPSGSSQLTWGGGNPWTGQHIRTDSPMVASKLGGHKSWSSYKAECWKRVKKPLSKRFFANHPHILPQGTPWCNLIWFQIHKISALPKIKWQSMFRRASMYRCSSRSRDGHESTNGQECIWGDECTSWHRCTDGHACIYGDECTHGQGCT